MKNNYFTKFIGNIKPAKLVLVLFAVITTFFQSYGQVRVPFTQRAAAATPTTKLYTIKGDFTMIGNSNLTLVNYNDNRNNSSNDMEFIDIDGDVSTYNSSSANLTFSTENGSVQTCSNILFAGLYWTGRGNNLTEANQRTVKFKGPGQSYQNVTAQSTTIANDNINYPGDSDMYTAYADVTNLVKAGGTGTYTVADVATSEGNGGGTGFYGGWSMVVVYENAKMNWRDVTIFDGYAYVTGGTTTSYELPVSGFKAVQNGPVNLKLGFTAGEGDRGISGDYFQIRNAADNNWVGLSHAGNTASNFFNSSIQTGGNTRNPNLLNNTGLDISMFNVSNNNNSIINNNQTTTRFRYGSTQDTYIICNLAFSVDSYVPEPEVIVQAIYINGVANPTSLVVKPGEVIDYEVEIAHSKLIF